MMKISTIVPNKYLHLVEDDDYHLCLVHQLRHEGTYFDFYKRMAEDRFVIVDNGAAEKEPSSIEEVHRLTVKLDAHELQTPDVFFDAYGTLQNSYEALRYLESVDYRGLVMGVPQGKDLKEWQHCMKTMVDWDCYDTIGIPKNLVHTSGSLGRAKATALILHEDEDLYIHLLGCWVTPEEVGTLNMWFGDKIRGVDSGIATIYAQAGLFLDPSKEDKPKMYVDFEGEVDETLLARNVEEWRRMCNGVM